jgi:hypothetical protein
VEVEAVALDAVAGALFNRLHQIGWEFDVEITDPAAVEAGEVAVWIRAMAVEAPLGFLETLDHTIAVE